MRDRRALRTGLLAAVVGLLGTAAIAAPPAPAVTLREADRWARFEALRAATGRLQPPELPHEAPCRMGTGSAGGAPRVTDCAAPRTTASSAAATQSKDPAPPIEETAVVPTPTGLMAPVALPPGGPGAYARVYQNGDVAVDDASGRQVWMRPAARFIEASGVGLPNPSIAPRIMFGLEPANPATIWGEDTFAVADLTGDGVADVVVAHFIRPGTRMPTARSGFVTLLDGGTGEVVWSHLYPGYVPNLAVAGRTLVVANQTGAPKSHAGEAGSVSSLHAWRFEGSGRKLAAFPAWTLPVAEWARWPALEVVQGNRVAAVWSTAEVGAEDAHGRLVVVDAATGVVAWDAVTDGHPRLLRRDTGSVVVLDQDDPVATDRPGYTLTARSVATGAVGARVRAEDALPIAFQVGDVDGGGAEWAVTDLALLPTGTCATLPEEDLLVGVCTNPVVGSARVRMLTPAGTELWSEARAAQPVTAATALPLGLLVQRSGSRTVVLAASLLESETETEFQAFDGRTGAPVWSWQRPNALVPAFLSAYDHAGRPAVLAASSRSNIYGTNVNFRSDGVPYGRVHHIEPYHVVSAFALDDGSGLVAYPALGDVYAAARIDARPGRGRDLVVGGESGAVFALDGDALGDNPGVLWRTAVSGQVRQLHVADLDGDRRDEVVAVSSRSVDVLDGRTGSVRWTAPYADDFAWTATVADVDGDRLPDVVVPARGMAAYRGSDGAVLWRHTPDPEAYFGTSAVTAEGLVVSQYFVRETPISNGSPVAGNQTVVALDARSGAARWQHSAGGAVSGPMLWRGVDAGTPPGSTAPVVAVTWGALGDDGGLHPHTDVYDAATGAPARGATSAEADAHQATVVVPWAGVEQLNSRRSMLLRADGSTADNLAPFTPTDIGLLPGSERVIVAVWPSTLHLLDGDVLNGGSMASHRVALWNRRLQIGGLTALPGPKGSTEILGYQRDWGGYSGSQSPMGRFAYALDVVLHGFVVLTVPEP